MEANVDRALVEIENHARKHFTSGESKKFVAREGVEIDLLVLVDGVVKLIQQLVRDDSRRVEMVRVFGAPYVRLARIRYVLEELPLSEKRTIDRRWVELGQICDIAESVLRDVDGGRFRDWHALIHEGAFKPAFAEQVTGSDSAFPRSTHAASDDEATIELRAEPLLPGGLEMDASKAWIAFFCRVKSRPEGFYNKCSEFLKQQDVYDVEDLVDCDFELLRGRAKHGNITVGQLNFLEQAVILARADKLKTLELASARSPETTTASASLATEGEVSCVLSDELASIDIPNTTRSLYSDGDLPSTAEEAEGELHATRYVEMSPAGRTDSLMKIRLQPISGDTPYTVELPIHATLADFRTEVSKKISGGVYAFDLLLSGTKLDSSRDGVTLSECSVTDNVTVTLVRKVTHTVLTASFDTTSKIWDSATGECLQTFSGHTGGVRSAVFSADGCSILTASEDHTAKIWDSATGECKQTLFGHTGEKTTAVFSADGSSVLITSYDKPTVEILDSATGECKQTLVGHTHIVWSAVFSADGSSILTASQDKTAKIWNSATGECKETISGHNDGLRSAVFSADGSSVLTASDDHTAKIWDSTIWQCRQTFSGHTSAVRSAVFSTDGSLVLTASQDMTAQIWDSITAECKQTLCGHTDGLRSAVFSADGSSVLTASADFTAKIWDTATGDCKQTLSGHALPVLSAVFSADG